MNNRALHNIHITRPGALQVCIFLCLALLWLFTAIPAEAQQQRFPMPEFDSGYELPDTSRPEPRASGMEYFDLAVLLGVMLLTTWMIFKKRSRKAIFWISVFSLLYFGFYRYGCICSVGAIQNLALALFGEGYAISLTVLAFFVVPLLFSLVVGRVFCASACPLGVIQDIVIVKPIRLKPWLQKTLSLFPFLYLGLAVLYAATGADFIICRYDPFVGIFRMGAEFHLVVLGIGFLVTGMFVARPYCRFVCPYGALLSITSRFSKYHLSITPEGCVNCKLCKDSCPFDAIDYPTDEKESRLTRHDTRKFVLYAVMLPVLIFAGGWLVSGAYKVIARTHPDVHLASLLIAEPDIIHDTDNLDIETFLASGKTIDMLVAEATIAQNRIRRGGWYLGGFLGLVIGLSLLNQVMLRKRNIYEANRADCFSCGRCMDYCPVGKPDHPYHTGHTPSEKV